MKGITLTTITFDDRPLNVGPSGSMRVLNVGPRNSFAGATIQCSNKCAKLICQSLSLFVIVCRALA